MLWDLFFDFAKHNFNHKNKKIDVIGGPKHRQHAGHDDSPCVAKMIDPFDKHSNPADRPFSIK